MKTTDFQVKQILFPSEREAFGKNWCGPEVYEHRKKTLIAKYVNFREVEIYCESPPSEIYTIQVRAQKNSVGELIKSWELKTGIGPEMAELAAKIAEAISNETIKLV